MVIGKNLTSKTRNEYKLIQLSIIKNEIEYERSVFINYDMFDNSPLQIVSGLGKGTVINTRKGPPK